VLKSGQQSADMDVSTTENNNTANDFSFDIFGWVSFDLMR